jgi:GAF domain-containing protein
LIDHAALQRAFGEYARALLGPYDIGQVLYRLTDQVVEVLGVDGAGVSISGDEGLEFVTATDERIMRVEARQIEVGDGPCQEAFRTGKMTTSSDLSGETRWPAYTAFAYELGCSAIVGVPMPASHQTIGAVNVYRDDPHDWTEDELEVAQLLADMAAGYITNVRKLDETRELSEQLQRALDSRIVIEQAKGIIAARRGVDMAEAFAHLRSHARNARRPLHDVATDVVASRLEI